MTGGEAGRCVVRVDGRDVAPVGAALVAEIATQAECAQAADPLEALGEVNGLLLLLDTTELLTGVGPVDPRGAPLAGSRHTWLCSPAGSHASTAWRTDPGWHGLVQHGCAAEPQRRRASAALLERRGVPGEQFADARSRSLADTRWRWPLVADVVAQGGDTQVARKLPGVVGTLLGTLIDTVPTVRHRRALDAHARRS